MRKHQNKVFRTPIRQPATYFVPKAGKATDKIPLLMVAYLFSGTEVDARTIGHET